MILIGTNPVESKRNESYSMTLPDRSVDEKISEVKFGVIGL